MRIQIIAGGIYDGNGKEVPVGTELEVSVEPKVWAGRYTVLSGGDREGKTPVTNPGGEGVKPAAKTGRRKGRG